MNGVDDARIEERVEERSDYAVPLRCFSPMPRQSITGCIPRNLLLTATRWLRESRPVVQPRNP